MPLPQGIHKVLLHLLELLVGYLGLGRAGIGAGGVDHGAVVPVEHGGERVDDRVLEDLARNSSVHAAGVVIGDQPLVNLLPLKQDEDGTIVTQYAMGPVGDLGLLKMDFLGLKTLTVIRNVCEMVKKTRGVDIPIDNLPLDDQTTVFVISQSGETADTLGALREA